MRYSVNNVEPFLERRRVKWTEQEFFMIVLVKCIILKQIKIWVQRFFKDVAVRKLESLEKRYVGFLDPLQLRIDKELYAQKISWKFFDGK